MYETKAYFYGTGRRKSSVARVRVYSGNGNITIRGLISMVDNVNRILDRVALYLA